MLRRSPQPNRAGLNNFLDYSTAPNDWNQLTAKNDERISSKDSVSLRYMRRPGNNDVYFAGGLSRFLNTQQSGSSFIGLSHTRMFTPTLINEARFNIMLQNNALQEADAAADYNTAWDLPSPSDPHLKGSPMIQITGMTLSATTRPSTKAATTPHRLTCLPGSRAAVPSNSG